MSSEDEPFSTIEEKINLIKDLFKGRKDVFAIHWEKGNKSGYMPAYSYDPYMYRLHKINGGTFKNYKDKTYLPLTDYQIEKHLNGGQLIGIYPLLKNNTSWFITADFDKKKWEKESRLLINTCLDKGIPAYLERSKSGNGGHVWIFFDEAYPAIKSRKILISLLEQTKIFSIFDKSSSFDRLFPNQNFLSGKGLGNLIALPLYKPAFENENSCFVDEDLEPYSNQWKFLSLIKRVSVVFLDDLYNSITENKSQLSSSQTHINSNKLQITLDNYVRLNRMGISTDLINFLKEELNFANSEYFIKKKAGKSTWKTERFFKFIEETENEVVIPRGFTGKLLRFCKQKKIDFKFHDERKKQSLVNFKTNFTLRSHQIHAIRSTSQKDFGVISAPPGSGKTIIGLKIIANKQQPALIIVHRKQLFEQWIERIVAFLGIPNKDIGKIGQGKAKIGTNITIAMIQSLRKQLEIRKLENLHQSFGTIIIDECHHIPAETFRHTISKLNSYYQYGLTATPFRKGNDGRTIFIHLGEIISDIKSQEIENYKRARIIVRKTTLDVPYNSKTDRFEILSNILIHDTERNNLIITDVSTELNKGKKVIIITERKAHIDTLHQFLKQSFEIVTLSGDDTESNRKDKWKILNEGNYQVLITTGQFFGEGSDLQNANCLFLVYPFSFKGKLIQYIGRVQRSEITPIIYDYRDKNIDYLNNLFLKRNTYYRHLDKEATLFDDVDESASILNDLITIEKKIKVPISGLDFRDGSIVFIYKSPKLTIELEFEIENDVIRPEFDVLKPYFSKLLRSKYIETDIYAEIQNNKLISQIATSPDLEKINREIIESVKFRFAEKWTIGRKYFQSKGENLLDLQQLQEHPSGLNVFKSEDELLNTMLNSKNVKHHKQLRYLASNHETTILKIRFVINPFSFVFLLKGIDQYHFIFETLNTKEATYIWHFERNNYELSENLQIINKDLNFIKSK